MNNNKINFSNYFNKINFKGLIYYQIFMLVIIISFTLIQIFGYKLYNSTDSEHEENSHTYGSNHHK